jgi:hypothetical protein
MIPRTQVQRTGSRERIQKGYGTRMLEVLEQLATAQAKQSLQTLAADTRDAELSRQAKVGLRRLQQR